MTLKLAVKIVLSVIWGSVKQKLSLSVLTTTLAFRSLYQCSKSLSILWVPWWWGAYERVSTTITSPAAMLILLAQKEDHGILSWISLKINDTRYWQSKQRKPNLTIKIDNAIDNAKQSAKISLKTTTQYACVNLKVCTSSTRAWNFGGLEQLLLAHCALLLYLRNGPI